jgi:DNA-directed RNA polymerase subunit RPC12/RpoP
LKKALKPPDEHRCGDQDDDNDNDLDRPSSIIPSKEKANLARLPKLACPHCGRKRVYSEKKIQAQKC